VFTASTHLSLSATNALVQESVRAFYKGWYPEVVTAIPIVESGFVTVPSGPGLGCELRPDIEKRFSVSKRFSA
jgi:L-alanine-DL-glutamate epimerase-like enolase superfamily enzyme